MISFFIPIRGGSKRVKNKNIKKINRNKFDIKTNNFEIFSKEFMKYYYEK